MTTWHLSRYTNMVLIVALVFNIEECFRASSNAVAGEHLNFRGLDTDAINRHLIRLQQSLRLIRSPKPRARFRPWGGKRGIRPLQTFPDSSYSSLCSSPNIPLELSFSSRCSEMMAKRDKFRPWGGKRDDTKIHWGNVQNQGDTSSMEDSIINDLQRALYSPVSKFERGMPESVSFDHTNEPNADDPDVRPYFEFMSPAEVGKMTASAAQKIENTIHSVKRQRFNPWAGKRAQRFNPWAGKRAQRFNPWAGKRSQLHPLMERDLISVNDDEQSQSEEEHGNTPHNSIYNQGEKSVRTKREITSDEREKALEIDNPEVAEDCTVNGAHGERCRPPVKRSQKGVVGGESIKRIGTLSDILEKYENMMSGTTQRSFHPWAGRKRWQVEKDGEQFQGENSSSRVPIRGGRVTPVNRKSETNADQSHIVKRNSDLGYEMADKRQSFYPWAGKRNDASRHDTGFGWLDYTNFPANFKTELKKAFNPWAGK